MSGVGTGLAIAGGIGAIGSVAGGMMGASAAGEAADAQMRASEMATAEQRRQYDLSREDLAPWRSAGGASINYLARILGIPGYVNAPGMAAPKLEDYLIKPTNPTTGTYDPSGYWGGGYDYNLPIDPSTGNPIVAPSVMGPGGGTGQPQYDYAAYNQAMSDYQNKQPIDLTQMLRATPGYKFQMKEGNKALEQSAAARGMSLSGNTLKALKEYSQGVADQTYNNYLNRIASVANVGQSATNAGATLGANMANQIGANYLNAGNARASGYINEANAYNGMFKGVAGGLGNALGSYNWSGGGGGSAPVGWGGGDPGWGIGAGGDSGWGVGIGGGY